MPIYLDHAATTPLDPRVLEAMLPYLTDHFGNASSPHALGRKARFAVEDARERVAALLGAGPAEIIFTSGATEANNLALYNAFRGPSGGHLITSATEHEAVLEPARNLSEHTHTVTFLKPDPQGVVTLAEVQGVRQSNTRLVSVMYANNEVGTLNPVHELAAWCVEQDILYHCDAVQAAGWARINIAEWPIDMLSLSAHKFNGPKGIGVLFVRAGRLDVQPLVRGGAQERRRRGGTENVAGIVGLATALELAYAEAEEKNKHLRNLQTILHRVLKDGLGDAVWFNTPFESRITAPHILNVSFPPRSGKGVDGEMLLLNLDVAGICASSGSACTSGAIEPSHVLEAMGVPRDTAAATVRFSLGTSNTEEEIRTAADQLIRIMARMRR